MPRQHQKPSGLNFLFVVKAEANEAVLVLEITVPVTVDPLLFAREGARTDTDGFNVIGVKGTKLIASRVEELDAKVAHL